MRRYPPPTVVCAPFFGYTRYWNDISGDAQLPVVQQGQALTLRHAGSEKRQSSPPPRYTEPKLVQTMEKLGIGRPSTYAPTCKVLREREYASLVKGHLQPTQLGMEVDEFLMRVLPKMIDPNFTAEMESALDDVAAGKQQWERYLINWNETYFAPALAGAYQSLGVTPSVGSRAGNSSFVTKTHCPKCDRFMHKISCRSKKLQADHFLKCPASECSTAMFWSDKHQTYELPYSERQESPQSSANTALKPDVLPAKKTFNRTSIPEKRNDAPSKTTKYPCPVCGQPLELYEYTKDNQQKQMLRCSNAQARRQDDHRQAVYFASKGVFWSPEYGEVGSASNGKLERNSRKEN